MSRLRPAADEIRIILVAGLLTLLADQLSKWAVLRLLSPDQPVELLGRFVRLNLVYNPGLAFGLPLRNALYFALLGSLLLAAIIILLVRNRQVAAGGERAAFPTTVAAAAGLALGAAAGNIVDRVRFGAVVDFIDLRFWPVFNLADIALTAAAVLIALHLLVGGRRKGYDGGS